jgi:hypothetical protein
MLRPAPRLPTLVVAVMLVTLGLVAPLVSKAVPQTGAEATAPAVAGTGGEQPTEGGRPAAQRAERARRAGLPAAVGAIVRSAAERLRTPLRPLVLAAVLVAVAFASLASTACGAVPAGRSRVRRRSSSPVRRRAPPRLVVA